MNQHFTPHKRELPTHVEVGASIASRPLRPVRFSGLARPVGEIWRLRSEVASDLRDTVSLLEKQRGVAPMDVTAAGPVKACEAVKVDLKAKK